MATLSTDRIIEAWLESLAERRPYYYSGRRLSANGHVLTGRTWNAWRAERSELDLAEYLPAGRGRRRPLLLITGDTWTPPPFHSSVQWIVRTAVQRAASELGADVAVIPFTALAGARIDRSTIVPLEIRPDRELETLHSLGALDLDNLETAPIRKPIDSVYSNGTTYQWPLRDGGYVARAQVTARRNGYGSDASMETLETPELTAPGYYARAGARWADTCRLEPDGRWYRVERRHLLGDCVFTAAVAGSRTVRRDWTAADVIAAARRFVRGTDADGSSARMVGMLDLDTPIVETVPVARRRRFVSSFDINEPRPLYFLATLPGSSRARSVDDAELDLAPAPVHAAIARGRDVQRQGDIFYVATNATDESLGAVAKTRARLTQWTRSAPARPYEVGGRPRPTAERMRAFRAYRRRRFRHHFQRIAAIPYEGTAGRPTSAKNARRRYARARAERDATLARLRDRARRAVLRGDRYGAYHARTQVQHHGRTYRSVFVGRDEYRRGYGSNANAAWRLADTDARRRYGLEPGYRDEVNERIRRALQVHGTTHTATEVWKVPGATYVRGIARHEPSLDSARAGGRDHVNIKLGDGRTWYVAIRNTVPRNGDARG